MRIVSQNGKISLSFEEVAVSVHGNTIVACSHKGKEDEDVFMMASYKTTADALDVMEQMHEAYMKPIKTVFRFPKERGV